MMLYTETLGNVLVEVSAEGQNFFVSCKTGFQVVMLSLTRLPWQPQQII